MCLCLSPDFESDKAKHRKRTIKALSHNYLQLNILDNYMQLLLLIMVVATLVYILAKQYYREIPAL